MSDIAALRSGSSRVVVAVGEETRSRLLLQCAGALADLLGSRPVTFPGDHGGFEGRPEAFAARLDHVLRGGPPDGARA